MFLCCCCFPEGGGEALWNQVFGDEEEKDLDCGKILSALFHQREEYL